MCIPDRDDEGSLVNRKLFGPDEGRNHRRLDFLYLPCDPKQLTEQNKANYTTECLADLTKKSSTDKKLSEILDYIGSPVLTMVYNTQRQNLTNYNEDSIVNESQLLYRQFDIKNPNFFMS